MTAKTDHRSIEPHISLTSRPIRADQGIHHARSWPQCARSTIWRVRRKAPGFRRGQPWALWLRRPVQLSPTKRHIRARILWSKNALPHRQGAIILSSVAEALEHPLVPLSRYCRSSVRARWVISLIASSPGSLAMVVAAAVAARDRALILFRSKQIGDLRPLG